MPSPAGGMSTFLPQVTKNLIVGFSRDPKKFAISDLYKLVPVDRMVGRYPKIRPQEASRLLDVDFRRFADGGVRPVSEFNKMQYDWVTYTCEQFAESIPMGNLALEQADFNIQQAQADQLALRAMLFRAKLFYTILSTSGNYISGYNDTATNFGGGTWANATTTNRYIQKSLRAIGQVIEKGTLGAVRYTDLTLVMSPTVAQIAAASSEIAEGFIQSTYADQLATGKGKLTASYGLPETLYGMRVVVDPTIETTTNLNASGTATNGYISSATNAYIIARPGDLVNNTGVATDFSTIACFVYKGSEMYTEVVEDTFNRRKVLSVIDNIDMKLVANECLGTITVTS